MRNRKERVSSLTTAPQKHAVAMLFTYRPQICQAYYAFVFITIFFSVVSKNHSESWMVYDIVLPCFTYKTCHDDIAILPRRKIPNVDRVRFEPISKLQLVCWIWVCFEERTGTKQMVMFNRYGYNVGPSYISWFILLNSHEYYKVISCDIFNNPKHP